MNHQTLATVSFVGTPPSAVSAFLARMKLGKDAWDLSVEPVLRERRSFWLGAGTSDDPFRVSNKPMPESVLAFVEFVSKEAPHHELSIGARFDLYYGFKRIAEVHVINTADSSIPAGRARTTKPVKSGFSATMYPAGTEVVLVESLDKERSEWLVEVRVPDETLVGGASFDVVEIALADLEPVP